MNHITKIIGHRLCEICKGEMPITNRRLDAKYCSKKCRKIANRKLFNNKRPNYNKEYYIKNKDKFVLHNKAYYLKNKKIIMEKNKEWEKNNPDIVKRWRFNNRAKSNLRNKKRYHNTLKFDKEYRAKMVLRQGERRRTEEGRLRMKQENELRKFSKCVWYIKKKGFNPSDELKKQIIDKFKKVTACFYCGSSIKLSLDHIAPLSKYKNNEIWNLVIACRKCNSSKHNKDPLVWAREINISLPQDFLINFEKLKNAMCEQKVRGDANE